jgi:predicted nucleotidyltransferase
MLDVSAEHLGLIVALLGEHVPGAEVLAFGSRVRGGAKKHSDLDLVVRSAGRLSLSTLGELRLAFQESDLPFRVDVVDWHAISDSFRSIIAERFETIAPGEGRPL